MLCCFPDIRQAPKWQLIDGKPPSGPYPVPVPSADWSRSLPDVTSIGLPAGCDLTWVASTGSTNADLTAGPAVGQRILVRAADEQTDGRGRAGRDWQCPRGAGLMFSVRLDLSGVPPQRRGWIGAVLALAILDALPVEANLKWPNDVQIGGRKLAGVLAEQVGDDVVVGAGINVSLTDVELPRPDATSLLLAGAAEVDRSALLVRILPDFLDLVSGWIAAGGDVDACGLRQAYRHACDTLGRSVRVLLPGGAEITGRAVDVDPTGALLVEAPDGDHAFAAGDVVHLR